MKLNDSIEKINKLGPQRAKRLKLLGIYTVEDLIEHFPRDYDDRSRITKISEIKQGERYTISAKICGKAKVSTGAAFSVTTLTVTDKSGFIELVWFNQPYFKNVFLNGTEYYFTGKAEASNNKLRIISPEYEKKSEVPLSAARIVPIYPLTEKITQKMLRGFVKEAISDLEEEMAEFLPEGIRSRYKLIPRFEAAKNIHFPESREMFFKARYRLVFEEFFLLRLALFAIKGVNRKEKTPVKIDATDTSALKLPFQLTAAQQRVLKEIKEDIKGGYAMYRLIQGDVGSGKTAVAMIACFMAIQSGYQAVMMAPTEVLAQQHYHSITDRFNALGIKTLLLSGSLNKKAKAAALDAIKSGQAKMIIGTHALFQEKVEYCRLGIVITDEQHRFGVKQRACLSAKGDMPHVLVMSATPIPRTLALILYGDLDVSVIDSLPPGRREIETYAVTSSYRKRVYNLIKSEIEAGRQCFIVCPAIDADEGSTDIKSVMAYTMEVRRDYLPGFRVEYLHGKMKNQEKQNIMEDFVKGKIHALISTTVIEVGVNVPNATIMLVENGERFGLSQLHQLRGRVGRGQHKSYCILISDSQSQVTAKRLAAMKSTSDGFKISELDLEIRGPGDFFGTRQHGLLEFKIANIYMDREILEKSGEAAEWAFENYEGYPPLKARVEELVNRHVEL